MNQGIYLKAFPSIEHSLEAVIPLKPETIDKISALIAQDIINNVGEQFLFEPMNHLTLFDVKETTKDLYVRAFRMLADACEDGRIKFDTN